MYTSSGLAYYRHPDWLGSSRFASTPNQTLFSDTALSPFGEPYAQAGTTDTSFTGQNQDTVSGIYDFPARELGQVSGRWPSPDPLGLGSVNTSDPQTWNRYAYVRNSPLNATDPTGMILRVPPLVNLADFGGFAGDPFSEGCTIEGMPTPCEFISLEVDFGAVVQCPGNVCSMVTEEVNGETRIAQYRCFTTGCGYYSYSGPGAAYYSANQAATAFGNKYIAQSNDRRG